MTYKAKIICFKSRYYTFRTTNFNPNPITRAIKRLRFVLRSDYDTLVNRNEEEYTLSL